MVHETSNGVENGFEKDKHTITPADTSSDLISNLESKHKADIKELTREIEQLRADNLTLKQHQTQEKQQKRKPLIVPQATRLVWGAETYMEGKTSDSEDLFDSYGAWYKSVSSTMTNEVSYTCSKYLFVRTEFGKRHDCIFFISKSGKTFIKGQNMAVIDALEDGWGHNQIASIMILHPEEPVKSLEVEFSCKGDDFHQWSARDLTEDCYGPNRSLLVCCTLNR